MIFITNDQDAFEWFSQGLPVPRNMRAHLFLRRSVDAGGKYFGVRTPERFEMLKRNSEGQAFSIDTTMPIFAASKQDGTGRRLLEWMKTQHVAMVLRRDVVQAAANQCRLLETQMLTDKVCLEQLRAGTGDLLLLQRMFPDAEVIWVEDLLASAAPPFAWTKPAGVPADAPVPPKLAEFFSLYALK